MPGSTTRRTVKKKLPRVKPTRTKKVKTKRTGKSKVGKTLSAVLNSVSGVARKIIPDKEQRIANRNSRIERRQINSVIGDDFSLPKLTNKISNERIGQDIERTVGVNSAQEDMKIAINPVTRKRDIDSATDSELLNKNKMMGDVEIYAPRKKKKDNTLLYILIAALVLFLILKNKK